MQKEEKLRYPIGNFEYGKTYSLADIRENLQTIAKFPKKLKKVLKKCDGSDLEKVYRTGGWTIRQVVHHLADSHMNGFIRLKLALTENLPVIKPYDEVQWAVTADINASVKLAYDILKPLHRKWAILIESMIENDFEKGYFHPATKRIIPAAEAIALYAWHSEHHLAHIKLALGKKKKNKKKNKSEKGKLEKDIEVMAKVEPNLAKPRRGRPPSPKEATIVKSDKIDIKPAPIEEIPKRKDRPAQIKVEEVKEKKVKKVKEDKPKMSVEERLAKARAARAANIATRPKVEQPEKVVKVKASKPPKNDRPKMTKGEVLALARAARATNIAARPKVEPPEKAVKVKAPKPPKNDRPKMTKGEVLALARAARATNIAARPKVEQPEKAVKVKAPKPPKDDRPKMTKGEVLALARAARAANIAARPKVEQPEKAVKVKAPKPPKDDRPKMSMEERLAKARAARAANIAARPKVEQPEENKQKLTRAEIMVKARAVRMANFAARKAAEKLGENSAEKTTTSSRIISPKEVDSTKIVARRVLQTENAEGVKLTRNEILANARDAKKTKSTEKIVAEEPSNKGKK